MLCHNYRRWRDVCTLSSPRQTGTPGTSEMVSLELYRNGDLEILTQDETSHPPPPRVDRGEHRPRVLEYQNISKVLESSLDSRVFMRSVTTFSKWLWEHQDLVIIITLQRYVLLYRVCDDWVPDLSPSSPRAETETEPNVVGRTVRDAGASEETVVE